MVAIDAVDAIKMVILHSYVIRSRIHNFLVNGHIEFGEMAETPTQPSSCQMTSPQHGDDISHSTPSATSKVTSKDFQCEKVKSERVDPSAIIRFARECLWTKLSRHKSNRQRKGYRNFKVKKKTDEKLTRKRSYQRSHTLSILDSVWSDLYAHYLRDVANWNESDLTEWRRHN